MTLVTYKWSIKEWHELIESGVLEGKPVELLDGEIIKMSPEGIPHSYTNDSVVKYLVMECNCNKTKSRVLTVGFCSA